MVSHVTNLAGLIRAISRLSPAWTVVLAGQSLAETCQVLDHYGFLAENNVLRNG